MLLKTHKQLAVAYISCIPCVTRLVSSDRNKLYGRPP